MLFAPLRYISVPLIRRGFVNAYVASAAFWDVDETLRISGITAPV